MSHSFSFSLSVIKLLVAVGAPLLMQCTSVATSQKAVPEAAPLAVASTVKATTSAQTAGVAESAGAGSNGEFDDLDEYAVVDMADPFEKLNRASFWFNDKVYLILFRPLSKGYEKVLPQRVRNGINNAFDNARLPVRVVNSALQGDFKRVGRHTEKFLVNTLGGLGGLIRASDKFPELAALPDEDTGKTFAKWGMGHGAYVVIPILGPSSIRDGVGLIADNALNPVNWGVYWRTEFDWTSIPPFVNTLRLMPPQLATYDDTKRDAIDPYIAVRSGYVQFRDEAVKK
jgi:phospholipid-binding lipoprotein MlaA